MAQNANSNDDGVRPVPYPRLFSPFALGRVELANRFVVPGLTTGFAEPGGYCGERLCRYLATRAQGGYGLVITENIGVDPSGQVIKDMVMAHDDSYVPGLRRLADAVHAEGGIVFGQLSHAGRQTKQKFTGMELVAPSPIPCPLNRDMPRELDRGGIAELEKAFVAAARRISEAGFDGIEIHGAHGYLVGGFLSAYSNKRADDYGGSLENRLRFLLNIVDGVKADLGGDFPVVVRISAREFVDEGNDLPEAIAIGSELAVHGVDALSVSVGVYESFNQLSMITGEPEGLWLDLAGAVRAAVDLPVIGVGRIKRPDVAEVAIGAGQIDLAAFGRASIADPDLPLKAARDHAARIDWCLGCNVCLGRSARPETICPVNPLVGRESLAMPMADPARCVMVLGSCIAACWAARVAALRGHDVTLATGVGGYGGMQGWRSRVPGQAEFMELVDVALRRAREAGVAVVDDVETVGPADALWGVRGFEPTAPFAALEGLTQVSAYDVAAERAVPPERGRIVVVGGDLCAAQTAYRLAEPGRTVRLVATAKDLGIDSHPGYRRYVRRQLSERRVAIELVPDGMLEPALLEAADVVVWGHGTGGDEVTAWRYPTPPVPVDTWIDDCWEAERMTGGIYRAIELARRFDEPAGDRESAA